MTRMHSPILSLLALALLAGVPPGARAQVFKCRAPGGGFTYSQTACAAAGLQDAGEVKIQAAPAPAPRANASSPGPAPTGTAVRNRPAPPPGVDDPLGDPQRPRLCAEQQNQLDASVAAIRQLLVEEQAQAAHFEGMERRIDAHNASPGPKGPSLVPTHRYAMRDQEKQAMTARIGQERMRLQAHVQEAYRLHCDVIGKPLRLAEAEELRYPPGWKPAR